MSLLGCIDCYCKLLWCVVSVLADLRKLSFSLICRNLQYIEADGAEHFHTLKGYPGNLEKKVTLLKYFLSYMNDHLLKVK